MAVQRSDVARVGRAAVGAAGQQHAQLFITFADGGNGLRAVQVALRGAAVGQRMGLGGGVGRVDRAPREHIGARGKAGAGRAAGHEHFQHAVGGVAQQQHGGCRAGGHRLAVRMQLLVDADAALYAAKHAGRNRVSVRNEVVLGV